MKKARRAARELALNILYQCDSAGVPFDEALETSLEFADLSGLDAKGRNASEEVRGYARSLAEGAREHKKSLDEAINRPVSYTHLRAHET